MDGEEPLLIATEEGFTVEFRGKRLYPGSRPAASARRRALACPPDERTLVYVPSIGLGYGLQDLLQRIPPTSAVLCVEREQALLALAVRQGLPLDDRLTVVRAGDPGSAAAALRRMGVHRFRRVREVSLCGGSQLAPGFYRSVLDALGREVATYWRNRMTMVHMGSLWVRNLFDNLPALPASALFADLGIEAPVWVAGAGPSLDGSMELLRAHRSKLVLVAADTALPALMARGLEPDFVVALESQLANLADFIPFSTARSVLLCDITSHPSVVRLFPGRRLFFSSSFAPLPLFDRMEAGGLLPHRIPPLGSVGVVAVALALQLGRGEVLLSGLDFSQATDRSHARGAPPHLYGLQRCTRRTPMGHEMAVSLLRRPGLRRADKRGSPTRTDRVLLTYRDQLERIAGGNGRVRDCAEQGLPLGAARITARETVDLLAARPDLAQRPWLRGGTPRAGAAEAVRGFLAAELRLLAEAARAVDQALRTPGREMGPAEEEALAAVDYAFLHFPDFGGFPAGGRSFLARAGGAVNAYAARLGRLAPEALQAAGRPLNPRTS